MTIHEGVLYYGDFDPTKSGGALVAVDLATGKTQCRARLKGLGPVLHSGYANRISLAVDRGAVRVFGKETAGRYVEYVSRESGLTVGHRVFPKE